MASCEICARETCDVPLARNTNFKYSPGDIYGLKESVYIPIYDILVQTFSKLTGESGALKRNRQHLDALTRFHNVDKGCRPAVIMRDSDDHRQGLLVCIGATYGGEDISKLPFIFRHFSIPLAFNGDISPDGTAHLHALPEWNKQDAYIIARPFQSTATLDGIWTAQAGEESGKVPQVLGEDTMEFFAKECTRRREEWEEMCKDPNVAAKLEAELTVHIERCRKQKLHAGASTTSLNSVATGIDAPSWRGPSTIPEEPEDSVVCGTTSNPQKPEPWKIVTKHRPGSTRSVSSAFSKKKGAQWDKFSTKSNRSRSSFSQKPHKVNGICNFDLLLAVKGR